MKSDVESIGIKLKDNIIANPEKAENVKTPEVGDAFSPAKNGLPEPAKTEVRKTEFSSDYFLDKGKIVEINDLSVVYNAGKLNEARAISNINFDIYSEEYIVIFGPSGCGKSTVLNTIAGLEVPSTGTVTVDKQNLAGLLPDDLAQFHRDKIGMIFQSYNLISTLSVMDNVVLPQVFENKRAKERKETGSAILERLGLGVLGKRFPQELSGGQQQRVGIARALINDPPIILADEAVGNLDSQSAKNVLDILNALNLENKKTIIAVTHNPEHLFYADRVFYMKDGRLVKIEVNKNKRHDQPKKAEIKKERSELDLLLQAYPDLSSMQLHVMLAPFKAKMLVAYFISQFESKEIKLLEKIVTDRLLGRLNEKEFFASLVLPISKEGLGLSHPLAEKFTEIVDEVIEKSDMIRGQNENIEKSEPNPIKELIDKLRYSLLEDFDGELSLEQIEALNKGIEFRVLHKISRDELMEYLDRPFAKGGAGLNRKTARKLSRKLEMIMLVEYGK